MPSYTHGDIVELKMMTPLALVVCHEGASWCMPEGDMSPPRIGFRDGTAE